LAAILYIITGTGNDTIYTNANINTKYDTEDNNVTNTVIAGRGSDKIYGSQGRDIVYGDDKENDDNNLSISDDDDIIKIYGGNNTYASNFNNRKDFIESKLFCA
jgi:Ca2+-binding RTX toxin-like protein